MNTASELAVHFAGVTAQQETKTYDGDLSTANLILECCQDTLEGAKAATTELEREEDLDEYLFEDLVVLWGPDWSVGQ